MVRVVEPREKGSDVNLASYLLLDAFADEYDLGVVVSNDSDLETPIAQAQARLGKQVGVYDPSKNHSFRLAQAATWYRSIREGPLSASQFPSVLQDDKGTITKPSSW